jgi:hypothetical protein
MSSPTTCAALSSATSLPESPDGRSPCASPVGETTDLFGQAVAPARPSAARGRKSSARSAEKSLSPIRARLECLLAWPAATNGTPTAGTSGRSSTDSSWSAALQRSLENKLQAAMGSSGSPEYELRWKNWDTPLGPPICALRASARRTSASGCTGWPTPDAAAMNASCDIEKHLSRLKSLKEKHNNGNGAGMTLGATSQLSGWPTPNIPNRGAEQREAKDARGAGGIDLQSTAQLAGWATPNVPNGGRSSNTSNYRADGSKQQVDLGAQATLAGWPTAKAEDAESAGTRHSRGTADTLTAVSRLAGRPTPHAMAGGSTSRSGDRKDELLIGGLARPLIPEREREREREREQRAANCVAGPRPARGIGRTLRA